MLQGIHLFFCIMSFLLHFVSTWGITYSSLLAPIAILQKKIMRSITFNEITTPSTPIFDTLQILKFNDVILLQITSFVYKCVNNLAPVYFRDFFRSIHNVHNIGTRQVIYLPYNVIQLNMDYALFITLVFGSGILFHRKSEAQIHFQIHFQILRKKLKAICYHFINHN